MGELQINVWNNRYGLQLAVEDDTGGYRIAGPKFDGTGKKVLGHEVTDRDAKEIRAYLDRYFPVTP